MPGRKRRSGAPSPRLEPVPEQTYPRSMSISVEKITEVVLSLPSDARALLADRLVESLDPITDEDVRDLWAQEALRRLEEIRSGQVASVPGEGALAQVRSRLRK